MQKYFRAGGWAKNCHRLLLWRKRMREGTDSLSLRRRWGNEEEKRKIRGGPKKRAKTESRAGESFRGGKTQGEWQSEGVTRLLRVKE